MPTAPAVWAAGNTTNYDRIFKAQFGSLLMRDYTGSGSTIPLDFNPFNSDGSIDWALFTTMGLINMGSMSENGAQFQPKYTTADTNVWQTRMPVRVDVESDQDECMVELMEATSVVDALRENQPFTGRQLDGAADYALLNSGVQPLLDRQAVVIGVDNQGGVEEYAVVVYDLCRSIKKDKFDWQPKNVSQTNITLDSFPDPFSGIARRFYRGGPRWLNSAEVLGLGTPVAAAVSGDKASLTFAPPTSGDSPYTYSVTQTTGGVSTAVPSGSITQSTSGSNIVLTVSDLTTGTAYTFTVTATGANGQHETSAASNSVTATA